MSIITGQHLELPEGTFVRNVIGSSGDIPYEKIGNKYQRCQYGNNSWIDVWQRKVPINNNNNNNNTCCACRSRDNILGAHIVLGHEGQKHTERANIVSKKSNRVFIIPLCNKCNQRRDSFQTLGTTYALHIFYYNFNIEHKMYYQMVCRSKLKASDATIFKGIDKWDKHFLKTSPNSTPSQSSYMGGKRRYYSNLKARCFR